jgi:hypothetical protein
MLFSDRFANALADFTPNTPSTYKSAANLRRRKRAAPSFCQLRSLGTCSGAL